MKRTGYVINYDGNGSVFVDEATFLTAVEYLQAKGLRIKETYWIELSEKEQVIPTLNGSSFGYLIGYGNPATQEDDVENIFVPQDDLKATCDRLYEQGYKVWSFNWACPVIDSMKGAQNYIINHYHNGGATEEQLSNLKELCDTLLTQDETQKEFVEQIALKTEDFKYITASACTALCENLRDIIAQYGE